MTSDSKNNNELRKQAFLKRCSQQTIAIHQPLQNPHATRGHPNPSGLGDAEKLSHSGSWGQSSVLFSDVATYRAADKAGHAPYGGAEYGVPQTPEAEAVCLKMAELHKGADAIICPSGLSAISTAIDAFAPSAVLIPDNVYWPTFRFLNRRRIPWFRYPAGASGEEFAAVLKEAKKTGASSEQLLVYLEAPVSVTFEIPDIEGIVAISETEGLRTVMDNTWASHVRFRPLEYGIDVVIQATTKYEGGYGDTPSGCVIAANKDDHKILSSEQRATGNGAVAPTTCARLLGRIATMQPRLNQHEETAGKLIRWFEGKSYVAEILSPTLATSPYHERFVKYFGKGNSLFSVVFKEEIAEEAVTAFADSLNLFWVAESWGGHVSLVLPMNRRREASSTLRGSLLRFHVGLEDADDLIRDLEQAERPLLARAFDQ